MLAKSQLNAHLRGDPVLLGVAYANWGDLEQIYDDYVRLRQNLRPAACRVSEPLRRMEAVHSLKVSLKDPLYVVGKVVTAEVKKPTLKISAENYRQYVRDLVGVQVMYLSTEDWQPIHDHLVAEYELCGPPLAYLPRGAASASAEAYRTRGCELRPHGADFRSVHFHYVVVVDFEGEVYPIEIQVRPLRYQRPLPPGGGGL